MCSSLWDHHRTEMVPLRSRLQLTITFDGVYKKVEVIEPDLITGCQCIAKRCREQLRRRCDDLRPLKIALNFLSGRVVNELSVHMMSNKFLLSGRRRRNRYQLGVLQIRL